MCLEQERKLLLAKASIIVCAILVAVFLDESHLKVFLGTSNYKSTVFLVGITFFYSIALAIPFLPASEIGLLVMLMSGPKGVVLIYIGTVIGLFLSFTIGINLRGNVKVSKYINALLSQQIYKRLGVRRPTICLALMLNIPGNILLGGGGGVALSFGTMNKLSKLRFLLTVMICTSPVPLCFYLFKYGD